MKSLVLQEPGKLVWQEIDEPTAAAGEAIVKVLRCGVCGTDIHAYHGRQPFFSCPRRLGHELAVEVVSVSSASDLSIGDRGSVEAYAFCGQCPACRTGKTNCCKRLSVLGVHVDGGHAPLIRVPVSRLHVNNDLDPDALALVEPLVIGSHAATRAALTRGEPCLILGMGPIGLAVGLFAKAAGANVVCVDQNQPRLDFAINTLGLGAGVQGGVGLHDRLLKHFGQLPAVVIDATGSQASMEACFELAEHGGRVVFVGLFLGDVSINDPNFHRRELTLSASRAGLSSTFRSVIDSMADGTIDALPMITHRIRFEELAERLPRIDQESGLVKAMIDFC
ncbi:zinc-binding alcohol dehydrogenase family protein [Novipirellula artificiosorum]|uniref:Putative L-galactonate oxidoreductase n=1 Tax=Novipirellula artificiosorum TaxID=2528016 RepID=A0A5C6DNC9_9BACT|nr:zinc-binding alcohol dehydrogenase family protein [Novipirellula artificiosorum]TWU37377.1 putative L-galactonate oxidoreductase [Novipirellula artificiosorum]